MANAGTLKKVAVDVFENFMETFEGESTFLENTKTFKYNSADMQDSDNNVWQPIQQHRPIFEGWDMTANTNTGLIEEAYRRTLGTPKNDFITLRVDDIRNRDYLDRAVKQSAMRQAAELNKTIANTIQNAGSLLVQYAGNSGYEFISEMDALKNERQTPMGEWCCALNNRDYIRFGADLAGRETLENRPAEAYEKGLIGQNIAGFRVLQTNTISNLAGGASPDTTVTANQSFAPEDGEVTNGVIVTNNDYREMTIPVADSTGYNVGDKVTFENGGTPVQALGQMDKTETNQPMTATIVAISGNNITFYPKFIAADDAALSTLEKSYANVDTTIASGAVVVRQNTDTAIKPNLFWMKDSVEVMQGEAPWDIMQSWGGLEVLTDTMKNGQRVYMVYDSNMVTAEIQFRLFTWYGVTNRMPHCNGVGLIS